MTDGIFTADSATARPLNEHQPTAAEKVIAVIRGNRAGLGPTGAVTRLKLMLDALPDILDDARENVPSAIAGDDTDAALVAGITTALQIASVQITSALADAQRLAARRTGATCTIGQVRHV